MGEFGRPRYITGFLALILLSMAICFSSTRHMGITGTANTFTKFVSNPDLRQIGNPETAALRDANAVATGYVPDTGDSTLKTDEGSLFVAEVIMSIDETIVGLPLSDRLRHLPQNVWRVLEENVAYVYSAHHDQRRADDVGIRIFGIVNTSMLSVYKDRPYKCLAWNDNYPNAAYVTTARVEPINTTNPYR